MEDLLGANILVDTGVIRIFAFHGNEYRGVVVRGFGVYHPGIQVIFQIFQTNIQIGDNRYPFNIMDKDEFYEAMNPKWNVFSPNDYPQPGTIFFTTVAVSPGTSLPAQFVLGEYDPTDRTFYCTQTLNLETIQNKLGFNVYNGNIVLVSKTDEGLIYMYPMSPIYYGLLM